MSQNTELKRKRCKNFTEEEKQFLLILVKYFENQIGSKKKDLATCKIKSETWVQITEVYNKYAYQPREARQLRIFYENTKAKMKKLKDKFVHIFLCDSEKDLLIKILNLFKRRNDQLDFDNIQNEIWNEIHQQFNKVTSTRQVTLLQLFVYYKTHLAVVENGTIDILPYVTVTIKTEPPENNANDEIQQEKKMKNSNTKNITRQSSSSDATSSVSDVEENCDVILQSLHAMETTEQVNNVSLGYKNIEYIIRKHKLELEMLKSKVEFTKMELNYKKEYMKLEIDKYKLQLLHNMELELVKQKQKMSEINFSNNK